MCTYPPRFGATEARSTLALCLHAMPTELPYAADAEVSLSYDELQVRISL
jgi:hypothetical protein